MSRISRIIFADCFSGLQVILGMLKGKTIVLPCHALSHLAHADWIVCLEQGRIAEQGTFRGLLESGGDFTDLVSTQVTCRCLRCLVRC